MERPGRVNIPSGAPSIRDWYVEWVGVATQICHHLGIGTSNGIPSFPGEQPRMVGLAGPGGAGKSTVASMVVTQVDVQAFFRGRVLWLSVGKGAKDRLPALMFELANRVRETVLQKMARRPREATVGIIRGRGGLHPRGGGQGRHALPGGSRRRLGRGGAGGAQESRGVGHLHHPQDRTVPGNPGDKAGGGPGGGGGDDASAGGRPWRASPPPPGGVRADEAVALILLYGDDFSESALKAAEAVLGTLERLSIHVDFVLDRPLAKHYTRDTALPRWRRYISSVRALNTYSSAWLDKVWEKLSKVEGEGFVRSPYNAALNAIMDDSEGELLEALRRAAEFHFCREDWSEAFDKYSNLLLIKEQTAGPHHPDVAKILHNLGMCACEVGREKETEGYLRRALTIQEEKLAPDDPHITSTLHSLGVYTRKSGKVEEAEGFIRRALDIRKGKLCTDPLILGRTLHSLGVGAYDAVRLEEAEDLLLRALATREGVLGSVHLEVADTLHVLGGCALEAGRMEDAEKLYLRALVIREEKLGRDHPDVSRTLRNLGICSVHKARLSEETAGVVRRTLAIV
ncbi:Tetratricopeptide TPR_2 repeat protein [Ectocarpus siliculosus]|uniref:Tetratricopeptide TPR_2 repeat protein n=1 Tax=Ectocarpus siliculosus TaxID=2880 RepID=D7FQM2_ECTSI|nr:Tetratricopeptide TPR_2 repeat protein [Ectocarpus siliculosus]|eukprot:CBJ30617.1 Tetratricopeptide TPR_2 repeat protein [Ectocarpus siliculosus]